jgi:sec-independent protein translocase protein TatB
MELFGISTAEFLVLLVLAVLVTGPKGLVQILRLFRKAIGQFRAFSAKLREETNLGGIAADLKLDPAQLDLRQYDPRAMVRQAVREEMEAWSRQAALGPAPAQTPPQGGTP